MAGVDIKDTHVAIVGAGIAGLALAIGLHKKGVPFTIYEGEKEYSVVGAGIGFGPNGDLAMDLIEEGFHSRYEAVCVGNKPADAQDVYFEGLLLQEGLGTHALPALTKQQAGKGSAKHLLQASKNLGMVIHPGATQTTSGELSAHRNAVLQILSSFIPIENVRFSKLLTDIQQFPDKVVLTFADGEVAEASALVGADGIKSVVREHVLNPLYPSQVEPVYADSYCYRGVIPIADAKDIFGDLTDVAKMYIGDKRCCVTYLISGGAEFNFLLCVADNKPWELKNAVTEKVTYEAMMADFEGRGVDDRFLRLLRKAKPIKWGLFHHRYTSTYYRDRVVLLGDSAHASLPFQAAGAGQGLEDALVLSNVLAKVFNTPEKVPALGPYIRAGFAGYDSVRRPRAQKQLERAYEMSLMIHFQHPETGSDMSKILPKLQQGWFNWVWFHDLNADIQSASRRMDEVINAQSLTSISP